MRYCARCLYPANHPLGLILDADGICSGCRVHEEKDVIDWAARKERLRSLTGAYRDRSGDNYDCIVPVSGARDSYFIVHTVKRELGLNPLLVTYNKQYNTRLGIRNLAYLRTLFDCDIMNLTVDPATVKKITRATLRRLGSMYWHCLAGQTVFPVQVAVRMKVPLIIWGAHQGLDQVGMFSHLDEVEMTRKYRKDHDLMGCEAEDLIGSEGLTERDLTQFAYAHDKEIESVGVRGIYLGNFIRWDSKAQHEAMVKAYGYETAVQARTFDTCNDVDSHHYSGLHDWIKVVKHGYGKATDHACREIRFGRLTREEGAELARRYRDVRPADLPLFLEWIGMGERELLETLDAHRDPRVWRREAEGAWTLLDPVEGHLEDPGVEAARLPRSGTWEFPNGVSRDPSAPPEGYVLIGRGHVDAVPAPALPALSKGARA